MSAALIREELSSNAYDAAIEIDLRIRRVDLGRRLIRRVIGASALLNASFLTLMLAAPLLGRRIRIDRILASAI